MLKTVSSITNAIGALNFKGTWDANANSPALASSVGTKGDYYVVGTAGTTNLNGISNWGVGDWATFNGSVWQRVEGGADLNGVNLSVSGTSTLSNLTASTALALNASKEIVSVTNTGTGDNVLATTPTLVGDVTLSTGNLVVGTSGKGITDSTGTNTLEFTSTETTANKILKAANFRTLFNGGSIAGLATATVLTLSSSVQGVYIVQANFGAQGSEIYTGVLIVAANAGSFRVVTNGSGTNSVMTLSGANVQLTNAIGAALDFVATAILIAG
jgi:hypothetical protein